MIEAILSGLLVAGIVSVLNFILWKRYLKPGEEVKNAIQELLNDENFQAQLGKASEVFAEKLKVGEQVKDGIQELLNDENFQAQLGKASEVFADKLKMSVLGSMGGTASGLSRQLKGAENEIMGAGIEAATGLPVGELAAKYLAKYPALKMFLPLLMRGAGGAVKEGGLP